jgi:crotonobetainyl-CoA:carnitine CoA-transferase CaiB-like acyl-CoA transferase
VELHHLTKHSRADDAAAVHGADPVDTVPSPKLGQHNREIYGDWLGLSPADIAALEQDGVI